MPLPYERLNTTGYAFTDADIKILLKSLRRRSNSLQEILSESTTICDPITMDDNSISLILTATKSAFKETNDLDKKTILCPIKQQGVFHWQLLRISKEKGKLSCCLYNTTGATMTIDEELHSQLKEILDEDIALEKGGIKKWDESCQKGLNCGLVVALMAHQLSFDDDAMRSDRTTYAGMSPKQIDSHIRDAVSGIVDQYGPEEKNTFCQTQSLGEWVSKVKDIEYDADDENQRTLHDACKTLTPEQLFSIKVELDTYTNELRTDHDQEKKLTPVQTLKDNLNKLDYAKFLLKIDADGEQTLRKEAENIVHYCFRRYKLTELTKSNANTKSDSMELGDDPEDELSEHRVNTSLHTLLTEGCHLSIENLAALREILMEELRGSKRGQAHLDEFYHMIVWHKMNAGSTADTRIEQPPEPSLESKDGCRTNNWSMIKPYNIHASPSRVLLQTANMPEATIHDTFDPTTSRAILDHLGSKENEVYQAILKKYLTKMLKPTSHGAPFLYSHQADAVLAATSCHLKNRGFLLADQPGTGKTRTMIAMAITHRAHEAYEEEGQSKKTLIITSNDIEKAVFDREMKQYKTCHPEDSLIIDNIEIRKTSTVLREEHFNQYDQVIIDEAHKAVDKRSCQSNQHTIGNGLMTIKKGTMEILRNKVLVPGKKIVLASATAAQSLQELIVYVKIIHPTSHLVSIKQTSLSEHEKIIWVKLIRNDLLSKGAFVSRMLEDSQTLQAQTRMGSNERSLITEKDDDASEKVKKLRLNLLGKYDCIVNKIAQIRGSLALQNQSKHNKDQYNSLNINFLPYIVRLRESIIISTLILEAKEQQELNCGYHMVLCVAEFGDNLKRTKSMLEKITEHAQDSMEIKQLIKELEQFNNEFPLATEKWLKTEGVDFNPHEINPKSKKQKHLIVLTGKKLTGISYNQLLSAEGIDYRREIKARGGEFHCHVVMVGRTRSATLAWQGAHRFVRVNNTEPLGKMLTIENAIFARISRMKCIKEKQAETLRALRFDSTSPDTLKSVIAEAKEQIKLSHPTNTHLTPLTALKPKQFLLEMDFLNSEDLITVMGKLEGALKTISSQLIKTFNTSDTTNVYFDKEKKISILTRDEFVFFNEAAIAHFNDFLKCVFSCEHQMYEDTKTGDMYYGWKLSPTSASQKTLVSQATFKILATFPREVYEKLLGDTIKSQSHRQGSKKRGSGKDTALKKRQKNSPPLPLHPGRRNKRASDVENNETGSNKRSTRRPTIIPVGQNPIKPPNKRTADSLLGFDDENKSKEGKAPAKKRDTRSSTTATEIMALFNELIQEKPNALNESALTDKLDVFIEAHGYHSLSHAISNTDNSSNQTLFYYLLLELDQWGLIEHCESKRGNNHSILGYLSQHDPSDLNSHHGWSLLHEAVLKSNATAVRYLCEPNNSSVELLNLQTDGYPTHSTALHIAMTTFADNFQTHDHQAPPESDGVLSRDISIIETLVCPPCEHSDKTQHWIDIDIEDGLGRLPIYLLCGVESNAAAYDYLIEQIKSDPVKQTLLAQKTKSDEKNSASYQSPSPSLSAESTVSTSSESDDNTETSSLIDPHECQNDIEREEKKLKMIADLLHKHGNQLTNDLRYLEQCKDKSEFNIADFNRLTLVLPLTSHGQTRRNDAITYLSLFFRAIQLKNRLIISSTRRIELDKALKINLTIFNRNEIIAKFSRLLLQVLSADETSQLLDSIKINSIADYEFLTGDLKVDPHLLRSPMEALTDKAFQALCKTNPTHDHERNRNLAFAIKHSDIHLAELLILTDCIHPLTHSTQYTVWHYFADHADTHMDLGTQQNTLQDLAAVLFKHCKDISRPNTRGKTFFSIINTKSHGDFCLYAGVMIDLTLSKKHSGEYLHDLPILLNQIKNSISKRLQKTIDDESLMKLESLLEKLEQVTPKTKTKNPMQRPLPATSHPAPAQAQDQDQAPDRQEEIPSDMDADIPNLPLLDDGEQLAQLAEEALYHPQSTLLLSASTTSRFKMAYQKAMRANELGSIRGRTLEATCLLTGRGVKRDQNKGYELALSASQSRDPLALALVAECLRTGIVVKRDMAESIKMFATSAYQGCPQAQMSLAILYHSTRDKRKKYQTKVLELASKASAQGIMSATIFHIRLLLAGAADIHPTATYYDAYTVANTAIKATGKTGCGYSRDVQLLRATSLMYLVLDNRLNAKDKYDGLMEAVQGLYKVSVLNPHDMLQTAMALLLYHTGDETCHKKAHAIMDQLSDSSANPGKYRSLFFTYGPLQKPGSKQPLQPDIFSCEPSVKDKDGNESDHEDETDDEDQDHDEDHDEDENEQGSGEEKEKSHSSEEDEDFDEYDFEGRQTAHV